MERKSAMRCCVHLHQRGRGSHGLALGGAIIFCLDDQVGAAQSRGLVAPPSAVWQMDCRVGAIF